MLPKLTPAVARALEAAQEYAHRLGAAQVEPSHLLYGLLGEVEGRASRLLTEAGLDVSAYRAALLAALPADATAPGATPLPLSPATERLLARARQLASEYAGDRTVASEQVLLAVLREEAALRRELEARGLVPGRVEAALATQQGPDLALEEPLDLTGPTERMDAARVLDAGANRAREALRVLEDYCRFVLDDTLLTRELKELRHSLSETLADLAPGLLLEARETLRDVGTSLTTAAEQTRHSLLAVAQANLKRLQEALRTLEEFGKLHGPQLGQAVERLRYRSYTIERALLLGTTARQRLAGARLCVLLTGERCTAALDWTLREAAAGGADMVQLREKKLSDRALLERARQVRRWTRELSLLFIVNDRPDIARLAEADGVHLGQDDLPVKEARRILGPGALVGVSTHNLDQVRRAVLDGASYLGVGPTFPSGTKAFAEFAGLEFVRQAAAATSLPAFVIGGINRNTVGAAVAAGARRVAVSEAICAADDPRSSAAALVQALPGP
jgi:thiamine-phosphate pyrophosphorylase